MQGMERAKAIRDLLKAATEKDPSAADRMALKDAMAAISRGERPEAVQNDPNWRDNGTERLEKIAKVEQSHGKLIATFEFSEPFKAKATVWVPWPGKCEDVSLSTEGGNRIILRGFWKADSSPEAVRRRLQLLLNELNKYGAKDDIRKAMIDLTISQSDSDDIFNGSNNDLAEVLRGLNDYGGKNFQIYKKISKLHWSWKSERDTEATYKLREVQRQLEAIAALQTVAKAEGWDYKKYIKEKKAQLKALAVELTAAVGKENEAKRWAVLDAHAQCDRLKSTPIENTKATYANTPTALKISEYRSKLTGHLTLDNLDAVANIAMPEVADAVRDVKDVCDHITREDKKADALALELKGIRRQIAAMQKNGQDCTSLAKYHNEKADEVNEWLFVQKKKLEDVCFERMLKFVESIRPRTSRTASEVATSVFSAGGLNAPLVGVGVRGLMAYPADMVEAVLTKKIQLSSADRASYCDMPRKMKLSHDDGVRTSIHEFGHVLEYRCPIIKALEAEFFKKRTAGQEPEKLAKLTGKDYRRDELAIPDHFIDPYMGKLYNEGFELVSVGFEKFYTNPGELMQDEEYFKFILGLILSVTP